MFVICLYSLSYVKRPSIIEPVDKAKFVTMSIWPHSRSIAKVIIEFALGPHLHAAESAICSRSAMDARAHWINADKTKPTASQ